MYGDNVSLKKRKRVLSQHTCIQNAECRIYVKIQYINTKVHSAAFFSVCLIVFSSTLTSQQPYSDD